MKLLITLLTVFRVAFVGDPQVDSRFELDCARRSVFRELSSRDDIDLVVILGDLVNDRMDLLGEMKSSLDSLPCPWVCTPGNHDRDIYDRSLHRARDLVSFRRVIGYTDTSFVCKGVRFISMDNVRAKSIGDYEGGFRESQKEWLENVLSEAKGQKTVLCTHIPLSHCHGRDSIETIFSGHEKNLLLVSGHTHTVQRSFVSEMNAEEIVVGATCGTWWRGKRDVRGIPYALMNCGAPRGYFVADFSRGKEKWYRLMYKPENRQDNCSVTVVDSMVVVNVYGGAKDGKVVVKVGNRRIRLKHSLRVAPEVQAVIDYNCSVGQGYRRSHRNEFIPMRSIKSTHLWEGVLPEDMRESPMTVIYKDKSMSFRQKTL